LRQRGTLGIRGCGGAAAGTHFWSSPSWFTRLNPSLSRVAISRVAAFARGRVGADHVFVAADGAYQLGKHDAYRISVAGRGQRLVARPAGGGPGWAAPGGLIVDAHRLGDHPGR
jgi:hypothetical protein